MEKKGRLIEYGRSPEYNKIIYTDSGVYYDKGFINLILNLILIWISGVCMCVCAYANTFLTCFLCLSWSLCHSTHFFLCFLWLYLNLQSCLSFPLIAVTILYRLCRTLTNFVYSSVLHSALKRNISQFMPSYNWQIKIPDQESLYFQSYYQNSGFFFFSIDSSFTKQIPKFSKHF